jgi:hypothetical protein
MRSAHVCHAVAASVIALLWLGGCGRDQYEVNLEPDGAAMQRELVYRPHSVPVAGSENATSEVVHLAERYGIDVPALEESSSYRFAGRFTGAMPDDVGGAGFFDRYDTTLGTMCVYIERFRGSHDVAEKIEHQFAAAETLVDLLRRWARETASPSPEADRIDQFFEQELQKDLKNLAAYLTASGLLDTPENSQQESCDEEAQKQAWLSLAAQVGQYLWERDYIDMDGLSRLAWSKQATPEESMEFVREVLVHKLRLADDRQLLQTLPPLETPELLVASLNDFLASTEEYQQFLARQKPPQPSEEPVQEVALLVELLIRTFELPVVMLFKWAGDSLDVGLSSPEEPLATNGNWSAETQRIRWSRSIETRDAEASRTPPDVLYAVWTEPEPTYQAERFGDLVLDKEELVRYCTWRRALQDHEGAQWDRFLETLSPDSDVAAEIQGFAFADAEESLSPAARALEAVQKLLIELLTPHEP